MTVVNVIETIDEILNLGIKEESDGNEISTATDERCKQLLSCCNFVLEDLYREHAIDCRHTVVEAVDGLIDVTDYHVCRIVSLVDSNGFNVPFKYSSDGLLVKRDGRYNLTYARLPNKLDFASEIVLPATVITYRMFVYGVIAEFLKRQGDYNKSAVWTDKFNAALKVAVSAKPNVVMPSRRWL